jgi:hypothetical protein
VETPLKHGFGTDEATELGLARGPRLLATDAAFYSVDTPRPLSISVFLIFRDVKERSAQ